jgi:uncharacterized membrane protein YfcA
MLSGAAVGLAFFIAGFVKGAIGVGLPTVAMGLLSLFIAPVQAAALLIVPAIGTNIWQMAAGPALARLLGRFATMMLGILAGTFLTIDLLARGGSTGPAILGLVLAAYGLYGLFGRRFEIAVAAERWLSPLMGFATGLLSGTTGVFVIPAVPYLASLRLEPEELVQAIGISAFFSPLALGLALAAHGRYPAAAAGASFLAVVPALAGLYVGQRLRRGLPAATFMRWLFIGLVVLGGYTFVRNAGLV